MTAALEAIYQSAVLLLFLVGILYAGYRKFRKPGEKFFYEDK